jgi:putative ABC transport system permease protein
LLLFIYMLAQLLRQSFTKQKRSMLLMVVSVAMGTAVAASLVTLALDVKGKVSRELRSFGANITIVPRVEGLADLAGQQRYLRQQDVIKSKTIFWRHNIIGVAPFLDAKASLSVNGNSRNIQAVGAWFDKDLPIPGEKEPFKAGVFSVSPWWSVKGSPPVGDNILVGITLAEELSLKEGDIVLIDGSPHKVSGTLSTGGKEDDQIFMELGSLQELKSLPDAITRVTVSALTTPMDDFAYKDPDSMSKIEYEKWYCTGYVTSIATQLEEVFKGSSARPIWQVAQTEGTVLERLTALIYFLTIAALLAAALGMSTTMAASVLRRLDEVGLMKALGADNIRISYIFLTEALLVGLVGGLLGYGLSILVTNFIGVQVFDVALSQRGILLPVSIGSALVIAGVGSLLPIRSAMRVKPAVVLKEAH